MSAYDEMWRDPEPTPRARTYKEQFDADPRAFFRDNTRVTSEGCWEWKGMRTYKGYGQVQFTQNGKTHFTHRLAYETFVGPMGDLLTDHLCRNRICCNPAHLEAVTPAENTRRGNCPGALAVRTNRCKRGHEFTEENTYLNPVSGGRQCKQCIRDTRRERRDAELRARAGGLRCGECDGLFRTTSGLGSHRRIHVLSEVA